MATDMYAGNVNATMTLLIMRGLGMGEFEIEQVAKYWMRKGAGEKVIEQMKEGRK